MTRLSAVAPALLVGLALLAGCTGVGTDGQQETTSPIRLEEVYLNNEDTEAHAVDVVVQRNETVAHWETIRMDGMSGDENATRISSGETIESSAWGDSAGRYVLFVRVDGRTTGERFDLRELGDDCTAVSLQVEIRDGGEVVILRESPCT